MSALLPCPFCGEGADLMELFEGFCGECGNCETTGPAAETEAAAIAAWNQRATPAEVAALRAEVEQAHSYLARLLQNTHPQCEPLPDLWGLCTQIDNMVTEIPKLRVEVERLRGALEGMMQGSVWKDAHTFIDGTPIGAGWHTIRMPTDEAMTAARAALAKEPGDEG